MRKQYHFQPASTPPGFDAWDVDRLIALSAGLPVDRIPVESIAELDSPYWSDGSGRSAHIRQIVEHLRYVLAADLAYPIILGSDGRVMDGMHRVARCLLEGRAEIDAVRFGDHVPPDYTSCQPDDLPYER